jgi:hypothetical protein
MRGGIAVVGLILLILGLVLVYIPVPGIPGTSTGSQNVPQGQGEKFSYPGTLAFLTSSIPYTVTWTSTNSTRIVVVDCGSDSGCLQALADPVVASGNGTSGTLSFSGHKGQTYAVLNEGPAATAAVNVQFSVPLIGGTVGSALLIVGIVVFLAGLAMKKKPPPTMPTTAETATAPPDEPA